jgi:ankyrin repeat protein
MRDSTHRGARHWISALLLYGVSAPLIAASSPGLMDAVRNGDTPAVRTLLQRGANPNERAGDGTTALHWAAYSGDLTTVDMLLQSGADANAADDLGVTPLWAGASTGQGAVVERLLKAGATPNAKLTSGETPLMAASRVGSTTAVRALVAAGADVNAREPLHEQTALMWASAERHAEVVKILLDSGADIHARSKTFPEVVNVAVQIFTNSGISAGLSAKVVDARAAERARGRTGGGGAAGAARPAVANNPAAANGGVDVVDTSGIVEIQSGGYTPMLFAAQKGDVESARLLLSNGADVNDVAPSGTSALVIATHSGNSEMAAYLLEKGANPNADEAGYTALHAAVLRRDTALVKALVAHGADLEVPVKKGTPARRNATDYMLGGPVIGSTAYWLAARFNEPDIMRILAGAGANTAPTTPDGTTILMAAMGTPWPGAGFSLPPDPVEQERAALDTVKTALQLNVDLNAVNKNGDTALHVAVTRGFDSVVRTLLAAGARFDVKNKRGATPLALATRAGRDDAVEMLQKSGAKE